jgi:hypothetical protein
MLIAEMKEERGTCALIDFDKDGGMSEIVNRIIEVADVAPTASLSGPSAGVEGSAVELTASATDPSRVDASTGFIFDWTVTKNGNAFTSGSGADIVFTPDDNATYVVSMTASDGVLASDPVEQTVSVGNAAPTAAISGPSSGAVDSPITFTAVIADAGSVDAVAGFDCEWTVMQNGNTIAVGTGAQITFTPDLTAVYVVSLSATDKDEETATVARSIDVGLGLPVVTLADAAAVDETGTAQFLVSLSSAVGYDVIVPYHTRDGSAKDGEDYSVASSSVTILAGYTTATIYVSTLRDLTDSSSEQFSVVLDNPASAAVLGSAIEALGTIRHERPTVSIGDVEVVEGETATFTASLSTAVTYDVAILFSTHPGTAVDGEDYEGKTQTVTIAAGDTSATFSVDTLLHEDGSSDETYMVAAAPRWQRRPAPAPAPAPAVPAATATIKRVTGDVTIYDHVGNPIDEANEASPGGVVFFSQGRQPVPMNVAFTIPSGAGGSVVLHYSKLIAVYRDANCTQPVVSDTTQLAAGGTFYVKPQAVSDRVADASVQLRYTKTGKTSQSLDDVAFTSAKAELVSIQFTSDWQDAFGANVLNPEPQSKYGSNVLPSDCSPVDACIEWKASNGTYLCRPTAQGMGTMVAATVTVRVDPLGISYRLASDDYPLSAEDYNGHFLRMDCEQRISTGREEKINLVAPIALPNLIIDLQRRVDWTIVVPNGPFLGQKLATTTHEVFVTFDEPIREWSLFANGTPRLGVPNAITDKRLRLVTAICAGATDEFEAADDIHQWLLGADDGCVIEWKGGSHPRIGAANDLWGLIGKENGMTGQCSEYGQLHELMLAQVGIHAEYEHLFGTEADYAKGEVRMYSARNRGRKYERDGKMLFLDFYNELNEGEGGIRIKNRFYTEGHRTSEVVIGVDNAQGTAEYHALITLAENFYGVGNAKRLQRFATRKDGKWQFLPPVVNMDFPPER